MKLIEALVKMLVTRRALLKALNAYTKESTEENNTLLHTAQDQYKTAQTVFIQMLGGWLDNAANQDQEFNLM